MAAKKLPPLTSYTCGACGTKLREGRWVYSRFSGSRYCIEDAPCEARRKKRRKA